MSRFLYCFWAICLVSCGPEFDELSTTEVIGEPEIIDANLISSTLRDNNDNPIAEAVVIFTSQSEEIRTKSDLNGDFDFVLPESIDHGYITVAKEYYDRQIIKYDRDNIIISQKLVLVDNPDLDFIYTDFNIADLYEVSGQIINPDMTPITGIEYQLIDKKTGQLETPASARFYTNADGQFSIMGVMDQNQESLVLRYSLPTDKCQTTIEESIMGQLPSASLGSLTFQKIPEEQLSIYPKVNNDCNPNVLSKIYFPAQQSLAIVGDPIRNFSLDYCTDKSNALLFIGVEERSGQHFDGEFHESSNHSSDYSLYPCTPSSWFLELDYRGIIDTLYDVVYNVTEARFESQNSSSPLSFVMEVDDVLTESFNNSNSGKDINFRAFKKFKYQHDINTDQNFDFDEKVYMNITKEDNDMISGVIMRVDQSTGFMKIRFRVEKV